MREILFRGKRTDNGKWCEGYLSKSRDENKQLKLCIDYEEKGVMCSSIVIPETVGQYTGLKDKNGKRIFEGDIVYCKSRLDNANMVVIFECGQFRMVLSENYRNYQTNSGFYDINCFDKEVIGNIHDNPELLRTPKNDEVRE